MWQEDGNSSQFSCISQIKYPYHSAHFYYFQQPMPSLILQHHNHAEIAGLLKQGGWSVTCLCAGWCDTCNSYRSNFDTLANWHSDKHFIWIDIEDQADVVGDLDIENFPTLLIQNGTTVTFFGPVQPDIQLANLLILSQMEKNREEIITEATSTPIRKDWQQHCNLQERLEAIGHV
jgi:thioredoxin 1